VVGLGLPAVIYAFPNRAAPLMVSGGADAPAVVTGGAGAIGGVLVRALVGQGREVRVVDNLSSGRMENLGELSADPRVRFLRADLKAPPDLRPVFSGASEVWHLAANPDIRRGTTDPRIDLEEGTIATFRVLDAARQANVPRVLFSSSSVVYGSPTKFPTPEDYGPLLPESNYGAAKLAAEAMLSGFCHSYGMHGWIFRFANIVGPGMTHGVLFDLLQKIKKDRRRLEVLGDGTQSKSYLRTEDCVSGMLLAAEKSNDAVTTLNLGSSDAISVREIVMKVLRAVGATPEVVYGQTRTGWRGDIPKQLLAIDRIRALGWNPSCGSAEAIDRTIPELRRIVGV
jgi:UDP-glucose 4-epimerase